MTFRASATSVVYDGFVYKFHSKEGADAFERCLQDASLAQCQLYIRPKDKHRCPVKLQSQADFIEGAREQRRQAYMANSKQKRLERFAESRRMPATASVELSAEDSTVAPPLTSDSQASASAPSLVPFNIHGSELPSTVPVVRPYDGKYVCYVVHGHGGHHEEIVKKHPQVKFPKVRLLFYCAQGETTQHTERRNKFNAPTKLIASLLTSKAERSRVHEIVEPGESCEPLMVQGDPDPSAWPDQGIWFVARESNDAAPFERVKIGEVPQTITLFHTIMETIIRPDARNRKLKAPVDIYWVACRALVRTGQSVVSAGANAT